MYMESGRNLPPDLAPRLFHSLSPSLARFLAPKLSLHRYHLTIVKLSLSLPPLLSRPLDLV